MLQKRPVECSICCTDRVTLRGAEVQGTQYFVGVEGHVKRGEGRVERTEVDVVDMLKDKRQGFRDRVSHHLLSKMSICRQLQQSNLIECTHRFEKAHVLSSLAKINALLLNACC